MTRDINHLRKRLVKDELLLLSRPDAEALLDIAEICEQLVGSAELGILGADVGVLNAGIWKDARKALDSLNIKAE